jgi:mono/diheme cytochrome c family protein
MTTFESDDPDAGKESNPMTEHQTVSPQNEADPIWRWLLGGLVGGGIILGLLIAAYAVGYHRGQDRPGTRAVSVATTTATTPAAATTTAPKPAAVGPVTATPALIAQGKTLFTSAGCSGCHSLNGTAGAGPTLKGLAGGESTLTNGQTVTADDAYLARSITDPDAQIVKGYGPGIMAPAVAGFDLAAKPVDVRALVAFVKSQK